ncbi:hypothetical protein [Sulfurovum sp. NBC37-1]|uniref:hypothetical protein n=1 Tax=Sulfurovum sp. (strain NBC37-1) TaxID=387093 RepID=UPI00015874CE|nr:hypothetical protein [Sulfurovum sp. NBC37-1]BAF71774.1 hypothetical protein SUN_0816 [Sulfurovum sp. NBC37-1]
MKTIIVSVILTTAVLAGDHVKKGEKLLYGFTTEKGKIITIAVDSHARYLVYRYGKEGKIELEYPKHHKNAFKRFTFSHYFRGGGAQNEGLDLNTLFFTNRGYTYRIFDNYSAADDHREIGIRITKKERRSPQYSGGSEASKVHSPVWRIIRSTLLLKVRNRICHDYDHPFSSRLRSPDPFSSFSLEHCL